MEEKVKELCKNKKYVSIIFKALIIFYLKSVFNALIFVLSFKWHLLSTSYGYVLDVVLK